jgi:hypothetical protein
MTTVPEEYRQRRMREGLRMEDRLRMEGSMTDKRKKSHAPYSYGERQRAVPGAIDETLRAHVAQHRASFIDDRNVFTYRHGRDWTTTHANDASFQRMHRIEAAAEIHSRDVVDHRVGIVGRHVETLSEIFRAKFAANLYETVGEAAETVGNVVNLSDEDLEEGLHRTLEKVEFGVNRYGKPTPPEMHVGQELALKLKALIDKGAGQMDERTEALHAKKEAQAIKREAARISRFRM